MRALSLLLTCLYALSGCGVIKVDLPGRVPAPEDPSLPPESTETTDDTSVTSGGPFEGDWTGEWTLTADYTADCDLGSELYHQIFIVDIEGQGGTLLASVDGYRMEGPDDPRLELVGTFPVSGNREEALASTDEEDTRIWLSAELMSDNRAHGVLDGFFSDGDGDNCELVEAYVEMRR